MQTKSSTRNACAVAATLILSACGGGGDDSTSLTPPPVSSTPPPSSSPPPPNPTTGVGSGLSLATNSVTFSTNNRNFTPPNQLIAATLDYTGTGTLDYKVELTGNGLTGVFMDVTQRTGQLTVVPSSTFFLKPGTYAATAKISVCVDDPGCQNNRLLGTAQTVNVSYTINSSVQGDVVSPYVVPAPGPGGLAGTLTGTVTLRGRGLSGATSVQFGSVAATQVTVISDTEVRASYPQLEDGTYPISINGGAIPFSGKVRALRTPGFPTGTLAYPTRPQEVVGMVYDAQRASVFVAARYAQSAGNQLFKFAYNGSSFNAPVALTIADIRDVTLSPDGNRLLVATDKSIIELNPETLAVLGTYMPAQDAVTSGSVRLNQLASANDGYVMVATASSTSAPGSPVYLYSSTDHTFQDTDYSAVSANIGTNVVGSHIAVAQGRFSEPLDTLLYNASEQMISYKNRSEPNRDDSTGIRSARPGMDRTGERIAFNGASTRIYNTAFAQIGALPSTTRAVGYSFDSTIVYTFDVQPTGESAIRGFDARITFQDNREVMTQSPVTLETGTNPVFMAMTPNAMQAIIGGISGVAFSGIL